ncbi:PQQ-binding-like beta-propeller repeat protein [Nonomuraea phyllanthi]|uniref:PQQ-binding-like beta-propeller repeat protein n=1 Tax=Nonomuraea phyllanthi TaxID=2219224 RepID=A0A5C4W7A2_9ACTN|nr:PQQ-binding-like beta-propeller repeat protein [Nonomuraea phyllanthi]KAB8192320.1 PQQ-binding-like beta-propeller repeat protein [Nonomuraea phyllanthi]
MTLIKRLLAGGLVAALAALGSAAPAAASAPHVEDLGVPLEDVLLIGGTVAPGPGGRTVLWGASSGSPAHLNAVDPVTGEEVGRYDLPTAGGSWAVDATPDGSVYVGTYGDGHLFRWTDQGGVQDLGRPLASENFIWSVAAGEGATVYGGTYPGGRLFAYDPATGVRDYGRLSPDHSYVRSVSYAGGKIYAGTEGPAAVFEIDAASGAVKQLPTPDGLDPEGKWAYDVNAEGGFVYVRYGGASPGPMYVWDIAAGSWTGTIDTAHGLDVSPPDDEGGVYLVKSGELVRYDPRTKAVTPTGMPFTGRVANTRGIGWAELGLPDYPGKSVVGLLWRGLMFRYNPQTKAKSFVQTAVKGEPIDVTTLAEGPDGRMYAGGFLNGGFAALDPKTGEREEFHTFSQSEGMTAHDGKLYIGAYPEARVYAYDPELPWNSTEYSPSPEPGHEPNPARLFDFAAEKQIRPRALVSAGRYLAAGTMPDLGELGGVLAVWDPETGALKHAERNVVKDQSIVSLAYRRGVLYGGTSIYSGQSATPPTQPEAKLFAWSVKENRLLWEIVPAPGKPAIPALTFDDRGRLWGIAGGEVFAVNTAARKVTTRVTLSDSTSSSGQLVYNRHDHTLYGAHAGQGVFSLDPRTGRHAELRQGPVHHLAVHGSGDVYFAEGPRLFRLTRQQIR